MMMDVTELESEEDFSSQPMRLFFTPKNPILPLILPPKISVNENRIFKNFGFYLLKFPDIEKHEFSIVYFSLGGV
jgi:hypothetical protein